MTWRSRLLTLATASGVCAVALELAFRALEPRLGVDRERLARFREFVLNRGEAALYEERPYYMYARPRGLDGVNSLGFTGPEPALAKRPGVLRVACIGSSTTEGGNPEGREGSYPYALERILNDDRKRAAEVVNFGMSGWTSAEEMVHYVLVVQDYAPDVVVVHEAANDVDPRNWPGFRPDYSHYRRSWQPPQHGVAYRTGVAVSDAFAAWAARDAWAVGLQAAVVRPPRGPYAFASGRLPPETVGAFRRNVRTIAEQARTHGAQVVLVTMPFDAARAPAFPVFQAGLAEHNAVVRDLAREQTATLVDLAAEVRASEAAMQFIDLVHMTPAGNRWKAARIAAAIVPGGAPH